MLVPVFFFFVNNTTFLMGDPTGQWPLNHYYHPESAEVGAACVLYTVPDR
jgi:hypothetical protein